MSPVRWHTFPLKGFSTQYVPERMTHFPSPAFPFLHFPFPIASEILYATYNIDKKEF